MKLFRRVLAPLLCCALLICTALPASAFLLGWGETKPAALASFAKNGPVDQVLSFTEDDFVSRMTGDSALDSITIISLPTASSGTLKIGNEELFPGVSVSLSALNGLRFYPNSNEASTAQFTFMPVFSTGAGTTPVTVTMHMLTQENTAPVAQNLTLKTYKNIPITSRFEAVDPDGDALTFQLTDKPARGELIFDEADPYAFVYSPYENKTGKDTFTYVAIDAVGNTSEPATVQIVIEKPATKVTYADLEGDPAHRAAIRLAEADVFVGECMGGQYFFRPDTQVTRAEFVAAALNTAGVTELSTVSRTGFADDDEIPAWAKPYAATALKTGAIQGLTGETGKIEFSAHSTITMAEAAVMLNRILELSDTSQTISCIDSGAIPTWAYQAAANLESCGVLDTDNTGAMRLSQTLTRADMAELLCNALDFIDSRSESGVIHW